MSPVANRFRRVKGLVRKNSQWSIEGRVPLTSLQDCT
jgi:hypothetical protein